MANLSSLTVSGILTRKKGTATASGTTVTVNLSTGNFFEISMDSITGSITTFTITESLSSNQVQVFFLKITQAATARNFSWGSINNVVWPNGGSDAPTITTTDNAVDVYTFQTYGQPSVDIWYGEIVGQDIK